MSTTELSVTVSMSKGVARVIEVTTIPLFDNAAKRFVIESDQNGVSYIKKRGNEYYFINHSYPTIKYPDGKMVRNDKIEPLEARKIIKSILWCRHTESGVK